MARRILQIAATAMVLAGCPEKDFDRAVALENKGQLAEAGELFVDIVKADPANLAAWDHAVDVWCRKKVDVGQCIGVLDLELDRLGNVERHHDALAEVLTLRARARMEQRLIDAALADLARAEKASPRRSETFSAKARALMMLGKREEAVEALRRAKELDPGNAEIEELLKTLPEPAGFGGK